MEKLDDYGKQGKNGGSEGTIERLIEGKTGEGKDYRKNGTLLEKK